ncbi:hypothetical protein [Pseudomonas aeruginosa]|nr:hypothetical protein [Pseudomonas aeruginosa]
MSKKKHQLIPLLDYLRIHRVIRSVLDSAVAGAECNTVIELKLEHHAA